MTWNYDPTEFDFDKDVDINVDQNLDFDTNVDFDKDVDVDINVDSDVDLDGNVAQITFSVEAIGTDTIAEADVAVLAIEGQLSSVDGALLAAAD